MQVKLRLQRFGRTKRPFYRIVAATSTEKRDGRFLEIVGVYQPIVSKTEQVKLNEERIMYWLNEGAKPTQTVEDLFSKEKFWLDFRLAHENKRVATIKRKNATKKSKVAAK